MAPCFKSGVTLKGLRGVENTASAVADLCVCVCVCVMLSQEQRHLSLPVVFCILLFFESKVSAL